MADRKFYMASGLENAAEVKALAGALKEAGWTQTYDWTTHGSVQGEGPQRMREVARAELLGVFDCNVLIAIMPGGRGTHVEIGYALGCDKPIVIYAKDEAALHGNQGHSCAFYHLVNVKITHDPSQILPMAELALGF